MGLTSIAMQIVWLLFLLLAPLMARAASCHNGAYATAPVAVQNGGSPWISRSMRSTNDRMTAAAF